MRDVFGKGQRQGSEFRAALAATADEHGARPEERGGEERIRLRVELLGAAHLDQPAALDDSDPVGDLEGLLLVVRDEDRRHAEPLLDLAEAPAKLRPDLDVERAEGLV